MAEGDPVSGRGLSYTQFVDASDAVTVATIYPAIVFNVSGGPIRLLRAVADERCVPGLDDVMTIWRLCAEQDFPPPHTLVVSAQTYDYLAGLLNGTIQFPRR